MILLRVLVVTGRPSALRSSSRAMSRQRAACNEPLSWARGWLLGSASGLHLESAPRCLPAPTLTRCPLDCIHLRHTTPLAANYSYRPHTSLPCPHTSRPPTCLVSWIAMRLLGAQCNRHAKHALTHCCCVDFEGIASKLFTMQQSSSAPRTYYSIRAVHRVLLQDLRYRPFSACASLRM